MMRDVSDEKGNVIMISPIYLAKEHFSRAD